MSGEPKDGTSVRVLLIEDNPADARLVREYLNEAQSAEFHVTKVKRMSEALERLGDVKFDVIILDLSLPDCSGLQTFELVAKPAGSTPIIVLTGLEEAEIEKQLMARGAHDYLRKRHLEPNILAAVVLNAAKAR
jgi:CheY-like chemotaxis protein